MLRRAVCCGVCCGQAARAYGKLRAERMNVRQVGPRIKKAKEAAKETEAN